MNARLLTVGLLVMLATQIVIVVAAADDDPVTHAERVVAALARTYGDARTLRAPFRQEIHTPLVTKPITSRGEVFFRRSPLCAVFAIEEPRVAVVRIDEASYQVHRPREKRAERFVFRQARIIDALPSVFAGDGTEVEKHFEISVPASEEKGIVRVMLKPRAAEARELFTTITLTVVEEPLALREITYENADGDRVRILMEGIVLDPALDDGRFSATLPDDTRVDVHEL